MRILEEMPSKINQILPVEKLWIPHSKFRPPHSISSLTLQSGFGIQEIIQPIAYQAEAQDGEKDGGSRKGYRPPGLANVNPFRDRRSEFYLGNLSWLPRLIPKGLIYPVGGGWSTLRSRPLT